MWCRGLALFTLHGRRALVSVVARLRSGQTGVREVSASERSVIPLQTRLRYTTMIVLPEGEEILDVVCGDKDFWVISATHNIAHVKPAKEGARDEPEPGDRERDGVLVPPDREERQCSPTLKVYVKADAERVAGKPKYHSRGAGRSAADRSSPRRARPLETASATRDEAIATFKQQYPTRLQFAYGMPKYEKPFFVRSIWHDGQFTYIKSDATSCRRCTS